MKLYETLATDIAESIRNGVLKPGDRLPSIRHCSQSRRISASTVFQAYYQLEAQGLIRARDRSGYFVALGQTEILPEPEPSPSPMGEAISLDVSEHVFEVLESSLMRSVVPFGSAFPSPLLFPLARLGQVFASSVQKLDPWSSVDDMTPGSARLRRQIALRYLTDGLQVHTNDIVITNGALEALNLCLGAVTRPGDSVIVESPTFYAALQTLERLGLHAIEVATHPREGVELDAMENAIKRHRPQACWLMTNFQNPLGSLMPNAKKQALVELLTRYDIPLIEDDVFGELYFGANRPIPAKAFDTAGIVMHCSSFSKCLAPGYRIGWTAPGRYARKVGHLKLMTSLASSAPAQEAIGTYLEKGGYDKHLRRLRQTLSSQQSHFVRAIGEYFPAGSRATRPDGGYLLWVEMPPQVNAMEVHRYALSEGISTAPGPIFSAKQEFRNCLRLNYGHSWDARSEKALATLGRIVAALSN
ncbi:transcriptional regulator, GntR family [Cupriavidus sp. YR651]|uniref:aminotransferase-like domain-containing protein n=1 Tax=Cupriavidus sp. YR651 TaxID=1855315 RepID=UPI0008873ABE|nr:PLP-dependent aminotransferase family protein [Cupriavidus sp. YR651]SDD96025.1 transcriptional regulator, GntR family [Cupriavidus sp. YR651]